MARWVEPLIQSVVFFKGNKNFYSFKRALEEKPTNTVSRFTRNMLILLGLGGDEKCGVE